MSRMQPICNTMQCIVLPCTAIFQLSTDSRNVSVAVILSASLSQCDNDAAQCFWRFFTGTECRREKSAFY